MLDLCYLFIGGLMAGHIILTEKLFYVKFWVAVSYGVLVLLFWLVVIPHHRDQEEAKDIEFIENFEVSE